MLKNQKTIAVAVLMLVFTTLFLYNTKSDFPLIFKKDLLAHDESSNSVVAANITRKFFPPMVRVNPLNQQQGNWMEGPYWQHIPPLFAYVPYLFFKLDGQVSIEVKRLSYAFVIWLTGLLFIFSVYKFRKSLLAASAATIAVIFWISTPFTHELITGYAFGVSDIVLAFTIVAGFSAILWYLNSESPERLNYPIRKLLIIGAIVALPICAKNLLGAITAATFFILLLRDHHAINKKVAAAAGSFVFLLLLYLLPLYFSSPLTFKNEIFVSFLHFKQLEGWSRPWHWYVTNYLPLRYLGRFTWWYYLGIIAGLAYYGLRIRTLDRRDKILLGFSGGWFLWNLIAISLVTSKVPNFIFQSYLLSLFFIVYGTVMVLKRFINYENYEFNTAILSRIAVWALVAALLITSYEIARFAHQFKAQRAQAYNYQSEHEKFYQLAEKLRNQKINSRDLVIINNPPNDCWERYYIVFLTGAESKTLLEMHFNTVSNSVINQKYRTIYFVDKDSSIIKIDTNKFNSILKVNSAEIDQEIQRIKKDKTSCQWLVPDSILNVP